MLDTLFGGKFMDFGSKFAAYSRGGPEKEEEALNPLCNLFPSVVSCTVRTGGATGNADLNNILCLLSNNVFNQYYFLIVWYWWVTLLAFSALGFVYRLAGIFLPDLSKKVFVNKMEPHGQDGLAARLKKLSSADFFLLGRICQNLKGSQIEQVLLELRKQEKRTVTAEESENHAVLDMDVEESSKEAKMPKLLFTE